MIIMNGFFVRFSGENSFERNFITLEKLGVLFQGM